MVERVASLTYLDTHVAVWAYLGRSDLFSPTAAEALEGGPLRISPMVHLELEFLHEIGRLRPRSAEVVQSLQAQLGIVTCDLAFSRVIERGRDLTWTRDPFDRVIVGHAVAADGWLLTRDQTIRSHLPQAVW